MTASTWRFFRRYVEICLSFSLPTERGRQIRFQARLVVRSTTTECTSRALTQVDFSETCAHVIRTNRWSPRLEPRVSIKPRLRPHWHLRQLRPMPDAHTLTRGTPDRSCRRNEIYLIARARAFRCRQLLPKFSSATGGGNDDEVLWPWLARARTAIL